MTLRLTPNMLRGAYDFLRTTQPFHRWKLPPGELVEFRVVAKPDERGWHTRSITVARHHIIGVSKASIAHSDSLIMVMAHEMVHVRQSDRGTETSNTMHNAEFRRLAKVVCRHHGFDPLLF